MQLGLYAIALPFKDPITGEVTPTENVIRDILVTSTIPTYSQFVPWIRETDADLRRLKNLNTRENQMGRSQIYVLPPEITTTSIMYIIDVTFPLHVGGGYSGVSHGDGFVAPIHGLYGAAQGVASSSAAAMLTSQMRSAPTFDYLGENKVRLYGFPKTTVQFKVACEHEPNGETIPDGCYDSFTQLATLDVKMFLYNTLKLYDGMATAHGAINLKIDEFQSADSERTTLLKEWGDVFHLDMDYTLFM
jgi:hypothetical protein